MQSRADGHRSQELKDQFPHQQNLLFTHPRKRTVASQLFSCAWDAEKKDAYRVFNK